MKAYKDMGIVDSGSRLKVKGRSSAPTGFRKVRNILNDLFYMPAWCAKPVEKIYPFMMCAQMQNDNAFGRCIVFGDDMSGLRCRPARYTECLSTRCMYVHGLYHGVAMSRYIRTFMKNIYRPDLNTAYIKFDQRLFDLYELRSAQWHKGNGENE